MTAVDLLECRSIAVAMALDQFQIGIARRFCHEYGLLHGSLWRAWPYL